MLVAASRYPRVRSNAARKAALEAARVAASLSGASIQLGGVHSKLVPILVRVVDRDHAARSVDEASGGAISRCGREKLAVAARRC